MITDVDKISEFVARLSKQAVDDSVVTNMYSGNDPGNKLRALNLKHYLNYFVKNPPYLILVGEAPGYKGCRVSGIPFTSTNLINSSGFFRSIGITDSEYLQNEATATIIWSYLNRIKKYPLLWNAFPFHPHDEGVKASNRKPNKSELKTGKLYLLEIMRLFPSADVIAVGNVAQEALKSVGVTAKCVRHPSRGGKQEFIAGLEKHLAT
ncbi:MAG: uracil-DNA glycosylase [bacterium]|nr:uracil-DNA glycosylase [bacterium]